MIKHMAVCSQCGSANYELTTLESFDGVDYHRSQIQAEFSETLKCPHCDQFTLHTSTYMNVEEEPIPQDSSSGCLGSLLLVASLVLPVVWSTQHLLT